MAPVPIRLRHPRGVVTLELDPASTTVDDLRVLVFSSTEIPPNEQELKYGYPPRPLPDTAGALWSIPIARGEQIIVTAVAPGPASPSASGRTPSSFSAPTPAPSVKPLDLALSAPTPTSLPPPPPPPAAPAVYVAPADAPVEPAESVELPGETGWLQLRVVPDDNSCLFSAVGIVFEGGIGAAQSLRRDAIRADPDTYSDVMLGQPREQYTSTILKPESWGGAIELAIFADHYKTEISSFDVASGRCDRFGEGQYDSRCVLVYSGIHYDALSVSPLPKSPAAFHTTVFAVADQTILPAAQQLVGQLRRRHYYTDTATFDLRCGVCRAGLKGEQGAREHARQTGHVEFGEY